MPHGQRHVGGVLPAAAAGASAHKASRRHLRPRAAAMGSGLCLAAACKVSQHLCACRARICSHFVALFIALHACPVWLATLCCPAAMHHTTVHQVLLEHKAALDPLSKLLTNWVAPAQPVDKCYCDWAGVTCNDAGAVVALNLSCKDKPTMGGKLPGTEAVWQGLPHLARLDVSSCGLTGPLPPALPASLVYLDISGNDFGSALPPSWSSLTRLETLKAETCRLTGVLTPAWGEAMRRLKYVRVGGNPDLTGPLPEAWCNMTALEEFEAPRTSLNSGLPDAWARLARLKKFVVFDTPLGGTLPASWASMTVCVADRFAAWHLQNWHIQSPTLVPLLLSCCDQVDGAF